MTRVCATNKLQRPPARR